MMPGFLVSGLGPFLREQTYKGARPSGEGAQLFASVRGMWMPQRHEPTPHQWLSTLLALHAAVLCLLGVCTRDVLTPGRARGVPALKRGSREAEKRGAAWGGGLGARGWAMQARWEF